MWASETSTWETVTPFEDGAAELAEHVGRLNLVLRRAVERFRQTLSSDHRSGLDGLAIFDEEIDAILEAPLGRTSTPSGVEMERRQIALRTRVSVDLPIEQIRRRFRLDDLEIDALLFCVAAELNPGYGRVYAYLNNDLTRQRPSLALIIEALCASWAERLEARRILGASSPLFRLALLTTHSGALNLTAELAVEPDVLAFLLGEQGARPAEPALGLDALFISAEERRALEDLRAALVKTDLDAPGGTIVILSGAPGAGRRTCAAALCQALGLRLGLAHRPAHGPGLLAEVAQGIRRARLSGAESGFYVPTAGSEQASPLPEMADGIVEAGGGLAFLFVDADDVPRPAGIKASRILKLHLGTPKADVRTAVWTRALDQQGLSLPASVIEDVAAIYPFNAGRIHACALEAAQAAQAGAALDRPRLAQICRGQTHHRLERLAQPLQTRHGWDDIVLPPDELNRLKEIADAVRNRDRVMDGWGFGEKVSAGPGVNAIFFGPSGAGKTMAASILAADLGMAIYRVELSRVVSKYIGETERNLEALFDEGRRSFAMLFFDEAEALFGKRSEVKDAHDRYANIEVAYLLQRMEQFEGVAILATNLRKHLDTAFLRRLQFAVEFPLPSADDRLRIWRKVWPAGAELAGDIDLPFMADHLELSGGHIRNVALTAAYLAAEGRSSIGMRHLVWATRREMQKLGRGCAPDQFGRYAGLFEPADAR